VRALALLELVLRRRPHGARGIWTGLALASFLLRQHQKRMASGVVTRRLELRPGESIVVTHTTQQQG
jgi:hypothetical protein